MHDKWESSRAENLEDLRCYSAVRTIGVHNSVRRMLHYSTSDLLCDQNLREQCRQLVIVPARKRSAVQRSAETSGLCSSRAFSKIVGCVGMREVRCTLHCKTHLVTLMTIARLHV